MKSDTRAVATQLRSYGDATINPMLAAEMLSTCGFDYRRAYFVVEGRYSGVCPARRLLRAVLRRSRRETDI